MAGFKKAKPEQAALKVGIYGLPGSGKTLTTLLCAEGLAKLSKKRIAFIDTERGTDFYAQKVAERRVHPEAFDFDALYTRSIVEILDGVKSLPVDQYGVIVIDSITHVWEAARNAYAGRMTKAGTLPFHAWGQIKKPYKELMGYLLSSPMHVFICGRQGNEFEESEETGEMKKVGVKMKAEGETAYEPHILFRMEAMRRGDAEAVNTAFVEKDRTGILSGRVFPSPSFDTLVKPLLHLLGKTQAQVESEDATGTQDAEKLSEREAEKEANSTITLQEYSARIALAKTRTDLEAIGKEITPELKKGMLAQHVAELREAYNAAAGKLK